VPDAVWHEARIITRPGHDAPAGHGPIVVAAAGTSDLPVAEEAAVTAELMGNDVDRLYDVGVAGLHRLLGERDASRPPACSSWWPAWRARCRASSAAWWRRR
jgi:NCAIR mutase (PurE)-related protein